MEARYGSLRLLAHGDRSQNVHSLCLGVVSIPDRCNWRDGLPFQFAKMIQTDNVSLMTGNFGRRNKSKNQQDRSCGCCDHRPQTLQ